ncbi:hypothetical protein L3X38_024884 [Prunus dulcis]|uniref:Uncharacterized protein n=1 Tax=Prunus dulcis TaxID=3755 RepID=A0AAD4W1H3_PRUDU|nr:hypothetical protein L3X38_024884 [Prunus dulcis]
MVVTIHFMDSDLNLHKRIICFTKITSHKGIDIEKTLDACLTDCGIHRVFTITVDNASANDGVVEYVAQSLKAMNTLMLDEKDLHLRCACHILNLIVKDGLKELSASIEGIRNWVKFIHSSPARLDNFREFSIACRMDKMANVPTDVRTRWKATYRMLEGAFKYRQVFEKMAYSCEVFQAYFLEEEKVKKVMVKRVGPPKDDDWDKALAFVYFLKKIYDATLKLSATKTCTSPIIFIELVALQVQIEAKMKGPRNPTMQRVASLMKLNLGEL